MISQLRGTLLEKSPPELVMDVGGVGYELSVPMSTFYKLPEVGQTIHLLTHLIIREDAHQLYGFASVAERKLFRSLIKVNGVGPKLGLAILSSIEPDSFVQTILSNDTDALIRLPGIGKKTAERLVIEMRDRLNDWCEITNDAAILSTQQIQKASFNANVQEAINALITLGYKPPEASRAVNKIAATEEHSCEMIIRAALKSLAKTS